MEKHITGNVLINLVEDKYMCKIISIINNKGGVGKTTSTGIIAQLLAYLGKRVLAIDLDQQSNLSMMLGQYEEDSAEIINGTESPSTPNITELFKYRYRDIESVTSLIRRTGINNLDIIPSSKRHKHTQLNIAKNETGNNNVILKRALALVRDNYDYILIDNAPANDILTVNSMFISDLVIVPVRLEGFSYKGLRETIDTILYIKDEHDIDSIKFGGAFITQAETNTNIYKALKSNYMNELGAKFYNTPIRKDIHISELETNFKPVLTYCPDTNAVFDYSRLILDLEILDPESSSALKHAIGVA